MIALHENYTASWYHEFLHSWPHISFSFHLLKEEEYSFENVEYFESLVMVALMAVVWLLLTMVGFAIYFCCLKVKGKSEAKYSQNGCYCSICVMTIFLMLNLGLIGVALYGNMQTDDGLTGVLGSVKVTNEGLFQYNTKVENLRLDFMDVVEDLQTLRPNDPDLLVVEEAVERAHDTINIFAVQLRDAEDRLAWYQQSWEATKSYRNLITFCILGLQCTVCLLGLFGLCCRSRCILIMTIVLGMFCITLTYFYLGVNLILNVGSSDFCISPYEITRNLTIEKNLISEEFVDYFLVCDPNITNPFMDDFEAWKGNLLEISLSAHNFFENKNITEDEENFLLLLEERVQNLNLQLDSVAAELECGRAVAVLETYVGSFCGQISEGLFALSAAMFAIGLCMTFALCAAAKKRSRGKKYDDDDNWDSDIELHDPFLRRATRLNNSNRNLEITRTNNPIYATGVSSNSNYGVASNTLTLTNRDSDEDTHFLETPPPYTAHSNSRRH